MKTYRIIREYDGIRKTYYWFAYELTLSHRLFGKPYGYVQGTCTTEGATDCENRLRESLCKHPDKVEWDVRL